MKKSIIGYKGLYKDENGYYCTPSNDNKTYYEVGKTYTLDSKLIMCLNGFHFCKNLNDVFNYYPLLQWTAVAEVRALGKIDDGENKSVTDKIEIIRILTFNEIINLMTGDKTGIPDDADNSASICIYKSENVHHCICIHTSENVYESNSVFNSRDVHYSESVNKSKHIINSQSIYKSCGINESHGISNSSGVNNSNAVIYSKGVNESKGIHYSNGVNYSEGISHGDGIFHSCGIYAGDGIINGYGVHNSRAMNNSFGVANSYGIEQSKGINVSSGVFNSHGISHSKGISNSEGVSQSYGLFECYGTACNFFAANMEEKPRIFGKEVSMERFKEVKEEFERISNNFVPKFNNLKALYLKFGNDWKSTPIQAAKTIQKEEAWSKMPKEAIAYLVSLPEFDAEIFYNVTGIKVESPVQAHDSASLSPSYPDSPVK
jgi:hypothetical protein